MYDKNSQNRLVEKTGYELWCLNYIAENLDVFDGGDSLTVVELNKGQEDKAQVTITCHEVVGIGYAMKVIESISPLTFVSSYKIIDMIIEWILEENYNFGKIKKVPWKFAEKIDEIKNTNLDFPPLIQAVPYLKDYLFALYDNLTKFRNEIIHNHSFSVSGDRLRIKTDYKSISYVLEIDKVQLGALVRLSIAYANLFAGKMSFGWKEELLIKHSLDRIATLHGLNEFKQKKPILINVIYNVPLQEGKFSVDLKHIREKLKQIHPKTTTVFDLKVRGYENELPAISWQFPVNAIPNTNYLNLITNEYKEYIV